MRPGSTTVAQCGYCQPGQVMAAAALVRKVRREQRKIKEKDLDAIRNICRCGTYGRIREAIEQGAGTCGERVGWMGP